MDAAPYRPGALLLAVLAVRWAALVWLVVVVASGFPVVAHPSHGWLLVAGATAWTVVMSLATRRPLPVVLLVADLALGAALLAVDVRTGFFVTVYPLAAAATTAAVNGLRAGAAAGALLVAVLVGTHAAGGFFRPGFTYPALEVLTDAFVVLLAVTGVGLVSSLLARSADEVRRAQAEQLRATRESARAAEREALSRKVHDSVLQSVALVHKRGRELAAREAARGGEAADDVAVLADLAAAQERELRDLLVRAPDPVPGGEAVSVRARLHESARRVAEVLDVHVAAAGDALLAPEVVAELGAAVDEALANVVRHAGTRRAWLLVERAADEVVVSVRDDGAGFAYDEGELRARGRFGLLHSIGGRVRDLGGTLAVDSAPGRGTELELRVPLVRAGGREAGAR